MGINTRGTIVRVYMLSSGLAALAGIVFSVYTSAGYARVGVGVEMDAIASVVIGGTLSSWWTRIAIGVLLFIALQRGLTLLWESRQHARVTRGVEK